MKNTIHSILFISILGLAPAVLLSQIKAPSFGKGIIIQGQDTSYKLKVGFRVQSLFNNEWKEDATTW